MVKHPMDLFLFHCRYYTLQNSIASNDSRVSLQAIHSPPVHLHVLTIEEEHCGWDEGDVKVLGVYWYDIHVGYEDICHLGYSNLVLGQLRTCW